ncbi:RHS repeat-associated core domain-containing protein [Chryseobacterium sp. GP-SGM7]|uniref:RHS repeat-associated core domain-containing protein n=1 Tax=Chryseobacterium sp. GP-SGM7 TaxID=3411323 RepID=UPI003B9612DF
MKKTFYATIKKNIELLPVFIPIILSLSSWTLYKVINNDKDIKTVKTSDIYKSPFKINCDFLKINNKVSGNSVLTKNNNDSSLINHKTARNILSHPSPDLNLKSLKSFSENFYSNLAKSGYVGEIGNSNTELRDANAADNIFDIQLSNFDKDKSYILIYEIDGYSNINSVTRSINGSYAMGGYLKSKKNGWTEVYESVDPAILKKGVNRILFNALNKGDYYMVKNVRITEKQDVVAPYTLVSKTYTDKNIYIRGFIHPGYGIKSVTIGGSKVYLQGNEFEYISDADDKSDQVILKFEGLLDVAEVVIRKSEKNTQFTEINPVDKKGHHIIFQDNAVQLKGLRLIDIPPSELSTTNVSEGYEGFRFVNLTSQEQKLHLAYDISKLPKGYQEKDISVFNFDYQKKSWVPMKIDSLNTAKKYLIVNSSLSYGDFMLGVAQQPESPDGGGHAQTSFNDSPIANPAAKINFITPPTPNQRGSANVSYPIEIPAGIGGFQPNVTLVYNSDNKFGWAGTGWDVPVETIDIDTRWGVPSFGNHETEIYQMAGEQLVFRDDYLPNKLPYSEVRTNDRRFYYRNGIKEGYIITRKGNSPSNYTWETLDGSGVKKEYLSIITTNPSNNSSGNIVKWFLSKVTDRFGNTIMYSYTDSFDGGGKNKYLSRIIYSNNTVIEFENEGGVRGDMTLNYKLGVKLTDSKILNKIVVKRANIKIREYQLDNVDKGLFAKRLLTEIIQKDGNGKIFNQHSLRYAKNIDVFGKSATHIYSTPKDNADAGSFSGGNTSFISGTYAKNKNFRGALSFGGGFCFLFGINKKGTLGVTASYDDNKAYGKNQLVDIDGDGLLDKVFYGSNGNINFRKNTRTGFSGVHSSIGLAGTPLHRHNTYGFTLGLEYSFANGVIGANYSFGNSNSPTYFSDVNGDGLIDMINYGDVFFNKIRNGVPQFQSQPINATSNVTEETPNAILAGSAARQDTIITTTVSKSLANIVRMWEAPVTGSIQINSDFFLTQNSQDGVDVWIEKGDMKKSNEDINGFSPFNSTQLSPIATLNTQGQNQSLNADTSVEKGQRIFIVASSKNNETGDRIKVNSDIRYTSVSGVSDLGIQDANGNYYFNFNSKSHYLASSQKQNIIADQSRVKISWDQLGKEIFTDDVDFKIYKSVRDIADTTSVISPASATLLYHHKLIKDENQQNVTPVSNQIPNIDITDMLVNTTGNTVTMFHFDVSADTNVSWEKIKWRPTMTVINPTDTTKVYATVQYNPYSERHINTLPKDFRKYLDRHFCKDDCIRCDANASYLFPDFNGNQSINTNYTINLPSLHSTKVTFSLKIKDSNGNVYTEKNTVDVINNVMPIPKISLCAFLKKIPLRAEEVFSYPFYFEISSADYTVSKKLSSVNPFIFHSEYLSDPYFANTDHKADYFGARSANPHYNINTGLVYQGWGGFSYNGSKYSNEPIRESEFITNPLANVPLPGGASPCNQSAPDYYTCMTNYILQQNNNRYFTPLELNAEKYAYTSPIEPAELGEEELQPYLLGVSSTSSNIITTPLFAVPNPRGIILRSTFDSFHAYVSGQIIPWLGISAHGGISTDRTSDYFQDFNGDGYPDVISGKKHQRTNILGQLGNVSSIAEKEVKNKGFILGAGISASPSVAKFSNTDSKFFAIGADKDSQTSSSSFALGIGFGLNIGKAWAQGTGVWADINGDGLTDYISDGNSYINTGDGFIVDNYNWDVSEVSKGDSFAISGGGGFSFANGSWAAGIGLSKSSFTAKVGMIDINGDGMADKIVKNGNTYEMWINTGTSFVQSTDFNKDFSLDNKQNSSGFNLYGTLCACLGVKVCISFGGNTDSSVSKQEVDLRDFDGDGYPDLLISDNDGQLTYYHNNFGKANLLRTVENPLQGAIQIGYDNVNQTENLSTLIGGTYQMPFSKTVMSKVGVWNFRPIDTTLPYLGNVLDPQKVKPQQVFDFEYEKGIQDRREREFLGFGIVKTKVLNHQDLNPILHQTYVTEYETDYTGNENDFYVNFNDTKVRKYFYKKGLIRSTYMLDSQNRKRSETKYTYKYFDQVSTEYVLNETLSDPQFKDIGRIIPLLYKTESTFTEYVGSSSHSKTTYTTVDKYDSFGNITRSVDKGSSLSMTSDDIVTQLSYHAPGLKNIVGTPSEQLVIKAHNNEVVRKNTTVLDAAQNITRISKDLLGTSNVSGTADFDMEYDAYGNMTKITYPESENGQRMFYNYEYDPSYHTYLISTLDAQGFTSSTKYDYNYLFGVPIKITNINGGISTYAYDTFGRLTEYLAPSDTDYTFKLHYYPSNTIPVAITERKTPYYSDTAELNYFTSLFTDAWGQGLMIKKLFKREGNNFYFANNIYDIKDHLGRPIKTILRDKVTMGTDIMHSLKLFDDYTTGENQSSQIFSTTIYDDLDRPVSITQHNVETNNGVQNLTTQIFYEFDNDRFGNTQFATRTVNPLGNTNVTYTDEFGRTVSTKQTNGITNIWQSYSYNRLNELTATQDASNNPTYYEYDNLGRNIKKNSADSGISVFNYDLSGKLIRSSNAILKSLGQNMHYTYNYDQLTKISYPAYPYHETTFEYGSVTGTPFERGRLIKQKDRTGTQDYKYDINGNVRETTRIVVAANNVPKMFKTSYTYDTYGRIELITYPDTETVYYKYNTPGLLEYVRNKLPGYSKPTKLIYDLQYNNRDQLVSYNANNNTKTEYNYDTWGKMQELLLIKNNLNNTVSTIRKNQYSFDGSGNLVNVAGTTPMVGNFPSDPLAIASNKQYIYDSFGRLKTSHITATGKEQTKYNFLSMKYNAAGAISVKESKLKTYINSIGCQYPNNEGDVGTYLYTDVNHPNAPTVIDYTKFQNFNAPMDCGQPLPDPTNMTREEFQYDLNGNLIRMRELDTQSNLLSDRKMFWDEDDNLKAVVIDKTYLNYYAYDAAGDRILKNDAISKNLYVNGNDPDEVTQMDAFIYYPNGYLVLSDKTMTKHYYMGSQRIATSVSKIPTHRFKINLTGVYDDLAAIMNEDIHLINQDAGLTHVVWVPNADSHGTYTAPTSSTQSDHLCDFLMAQQMYAFYTDNNIECFDKISDLYNSAMSNGNYCDMWNQFLADECMIGYTPPEIVESEMYWIHPDHFSGASILTDNKGGVTNWYEYMPYGEMLMENTNFSYDNPYKYNAKEFDASTGYYYYGARYYDPKRSFWLSVDPLAEITMSPYAYVWNDPVNFADPTGMMGERVGGKNPKDWYRDRLGNVSWHDSQADEIIGKNGETLKRLGKSGSYFNAKGGVTDLNSDRTVTEGGKTSFLINPTPMSPSSLLGDDDRKISSPGITPASFSSFDTTKNTPLASPRSGGHSLSYDISILAVPYMLLEAGLAEGLMQAGADGNTASNTAKVATLLYGFKAPKGVTGELGILGGKGAGRNIKIDVSNLPKTVTEDFTEILSGRGTPRMTGNTQTILENRGGVNLKWVGASEWKIRDVKNTGLNGSRILQHPDGRWGLIINHNYKNVIQLPTSSKLK